jgi:hypothetical protein
MIAIKTALTIIRDTNIAQPIVVAIDSLSSLKSIKSGHSKTNPNLLNDIKTLAAEIKTNLQIIWVPSHIGISGNKAADKLAFQATTKTQIDITVPFEQSDINKIATEIINDKWSQTWINKPKIAHYYQVTPKLHPVIPKATNRKDSRIFFRLRSGYSLLNSNLHLYKLHPTGLCDTCNVPETTTHFLRECNSQLVTEIKNHCINTNNPFTIPSVLNSASTPTLISRIIDRHL